MDATGWNAAGHLARREKRWAEGDEAFGGMIAAAEKERHTWWRVVGYVCRGLCRRQLGRTAEAIGDYSAAMEVSENRAAAVYYRGNALLAEGRWEEAEGDQRRAAEFHRGSLEPVEPVFTYPADLALAVTDCTGAIEAGKGGAAALFSRGYARELLRRFPGAVEDYEDAGRDGGLRAAAEWALARTRESALGVRPEERGLMEPGVEYCCVTFDGDGGTTEVEYYDLESRRVERIRGEILGRLERDGWRYGTGSSHKEGYTYYYQRKNWR